MIICHAHTKNPLLFKIKRKILKVMPQLQHKYIWRELYLKRTGESKVKDLACYFKSVCKLEASSSLQFQTICSSPSHQALSSLRLHSLTLSSSLHCSEPGPVSNPPFLKTTPSLGLCFTQVLAWASFLQLITGSEPFWLPCNTQALNKIECELPSLGKWIWACPVASHIQPNKVSKVKSQFLCIFSHCHSNTLKM